MFISEEQIARVRDSNDIIDVIAEFVPHLKRSGKDFKALCPFHQEKSPSFMVSPAKGIFHCFGCGVGGDVFKFVMEFEHLSYPESIRRLAERKGIAIHESETSDSGSKNQQKRKKLLEILERAGHFYHRTLLESAEAKQALTYLSDSRSLKIETIERFQLGWAPSSGQALIKSALKIGFSTEDLREAGLAHRYEQNGKWVDWFRGRILFPIHDVKGQVIAFGGRVLDSKGTNRENPPPKYINSTETDLFQKGKNLYGLYFGSRKIRESRHVVVLEGYMDVIGCHQAGIENAVAPLGTSLTSDQCQLLKRYVDQVTLLFDSDGAGQTASLRSSELLLDYHFFPVIAELPAGEDADEFLVKHSVAEFEKMLAQGLSTVEFKLKTLLSKHEKLPDVIRKITVCQSVLPLLLKVDSEIVRSEMVKSISRVLEVKEEFVYAEFKKLKNKGKPSKFELNPNVPDKHFLNSEEELLLLIVNHPALRSKFTKLVDQHSSELDPRLVECAKVLQNSPESLGVAGIMKSLSAETSEWVRKLLFEEIRSDDPDKIFDSLASNIEDAIKERERKKLEKQVIEFLNQGGMNLKQEIAQYQELTKSLKGKIK